MRTVVPSLPAASFTELESLATALRGVARELQVDIVDGQFVPAVAWPFTEADPFAALAQLAEFTTDFEIEVDCMVLDPLQYLDTLAALKIPRVIIHIGSTDEYSACIAHARMHGYKIGFAFTNDIPLSEVSIFLDKIDFVQVMGIAHVGSQGQPFDTRTLTTVASLRARYPELEIAVDGSVNSDTIPQLFQAGVTRFAPGSAIAKQPNQKAAFTALVAQVQSLESMHN